MRRRRRRRPEGKGGRKNPQTYSGRLQTRPSGATLFLSRALLHSDSSDGTDGPGRPRGHRHRKRKAPGGGGQGRQAGRQAGSPRGEMVSTPGSDLAFPPPTATTSRARLANFRFCFFSFFLLRVSDEESSRSCYCTCFSQVRLPIILGPPVPPRTSGVSPVEGITLRRGARPKRGDVSGRRNILE